MDGWHCTDLDLGGSIGMPIVARARRSQRADPTAHVDHGLWATLAALLSLPLRWLSWAVLSQVLTDHHDDPERAADAALKAVDWPAATAPVADELAKVIAAPFSAAAREVGATFAPTDAISWARRHAAERVVSITEPTRAAIREAVVTGLREGQSVDVVARRVQQSVGLHPQWAKAVANYDARAAARGVTPARRAEMTAQYREGLVARRAQNIARTELLTASAQGRLAGYEQMAANAGGIEMEKTWITARETSKQGRVVCPLCKPLNGKKVRGLATLFRSGAFAVAVPPLHASCRCSFSAVPTPALSLVTKDEHWRSELHPRDRQGRFAGIGHVVGRVVELIGGGSRGFTMHPYSGELEGSGFVAAFRGSKIFKSDDFISRRDEVVEGVLSKLIAARDGLKRDDRIRFGAWHDEDNDEYVFDHVMLLPNTPDGRLTAQLIGVSENQQYVYHLDTDESIPTGGTGDRGP